MHSSYTQGRDGPSISRVDYYGDAAWYPDQPCEFLVSVFVSSGMAQSGGMGLAPLTWVEIDALNNAMRYELRPRECQVLRQMSQAYCSWVKKGESQNCEPPIEPTDDDAIERIQLQNQLRMREMLSARKR